MDQTRCYFWSYRSGRPKSKFSNPSRGKLVENTLFYEEKKKCRNLSPSKMKQWIKIWIAAQGWRNSYMVSGPATFGTERREVPTLPQNRLSVEKCIIKTNSSQSSTNTPCIGKNTDSRTHRRDRAFCISFPVYSNSDRLNRMPQAVERALPAKVWSSSVVTVCPSTIQGHKVV